MHRGQISRSPLIIVLTRGRTGSTMLMEALSRTGVRAYQELLTTDPRHECSHHRCAVNGRCVALVSRPVGTPLSDYLGSLLSPNVTTAFKALYRHAFLDYADFLPAIKACQASVIHLTRDPVEEAVSAAYARATGIYNVSSARIDVSLKLWLHTYLKRVDIDIDYVLGEVGATLEWRKRATEALDAWGLEHFDISYDDLVSSDPSSRYPLLLQWLGVQADASGLASARRRWKRVLSRPAWQISNYDALTRALDGLPAP